MTREPTHCVHGRSLNLRCGPPGRVVEEPQAVRYTPEVEQVVAEVVVAERNRIAAKLRERAAMGFLTPEAAMSIRLIAAELDDGTL